MMRLKKFNEEVFFAEDSPVKVSREDIDFLKEHMARSGRARVRLCAHPDAQDVLHEMFIVLKKDGYVRPHKHLTKIESFLILSGLVDAVLLDEIGTVTEVIRMGDYSSGLRFFYRMSRPAYHTFLIRSDFLVFKEVCNGPFEKSDTAFASWAPAESDSAAGRDYLLKVEMAAALSLKKK